MERGMQRGWHHKPVVGEVESRRIKKQYLWELPHEIQWN